jgi:DNA-binding NtrC family response regulator
MAHLAHRIGGAEELELHIMDFFGSEEDGALFSSANQSAEGVPHATLVARKVDHAPKRIQQQLHNHLVGQLAGVYDPRIIVTSDPIDITNGASKDLHLDLFAFLYPSMILVPPLRNRIEDIGPLMTFHAAKTNAEDPVPRMTPNAMKALREYHWPMNVQELETVTRFILERKPAGRISEADLPDGVLSAYAVSDRVLDILTEIHRSEGFRVLSCESRRRDMARFLAEPQGASFGALDFMKAFNQGRETSRRILALFVSHGLVEPVKGATQQRTIRYRRLAYSGSSSDKA